jgi:hypothetical protein
MNKFWIISLTYCLFGISGCQKESNTETTTQTTLDANGNLTSHEESTDYVWDTNSVVNIQLNGTSASIDKSGAAANGSEVTISAPGTYRIIGNLIDGQILVNSQDNGVVRLILNGVTIHNSKSAPLFIKKSAKTVLILNDNTGNFFSDATTYVYENTEDDEPNAAIFSKSNLTICGNGSLSVTGNFNDAITSKDGLVIRNANINVTSVDDGIRGKDYLVINKAKITAIVSGDGLKSDNKKDKSRGYISVLDGELNIISLGDAIAAKTDVLITTGTFNLNAGGGSSVSKNESRSTKGIKGLASVIIDGGNFNINSADDGIHTNNELLINKGIFSISSSDDGIHADTKLTINDGEVTVSKSYEGIESAAITVNGGTLSITSTDDAFNATKGLVAGGTESNDGSMLSFNGGLIYVNASRGDGLDSNGSIEITGGTTIVNGPQSQPEVGMDYNGSCIISGGFLIISAINSNMTQGAGTNSTQYSLKLLLTKTIAANSLFHIESSGGKELVTIAPVRSYSSIVFSSPDLKKDSTYYIYTGGNSTGTLSNNLYTGGRYSGGTLYTSFKISNMLTSIGSSQGPGGGF